MKSINATDADIAMVKELRRLMLLVLAVPAAPLEHVVQMAHESSAYDDEDPPEVFEDQGVTRQSLRMLWNFRCYLEAALPQEEARG